jgi:hypothetical protein
VVIEAAHQCMTTRGVHKPGDHGDLTMLGAFREDSRTRRVPLDDPQFGRRRLAPRHDSASPVLDMVQRLIAFDTVSRNSNLDLIAFAQNARTSRQRRSSPMTTPDSNRSPVWEPQRDGGYVLSGHTDVVPVDGRWSAILSPLKFATAVSTGGAAGMKVHRCRVGASARICRSI